MSQNTSYRRQHITDCSQDNQYFQDLYHIFCATLNPNMPFDKFYEYYYSARLDYIDVTFILVEREIVGFCSAAFYTDTVDKQKNTFGRAATGILENYRGHNLPKWRLYQKYIRYWMKMSRRRILLLVYAANPLIYGMICKYTGIVYPKKGVKIPVEIKLLKDGLLKNENLDKTEYPEFVIDFHFSVPIKAHEQQRIYKSKNQHVKYYLEINPNFLKPRVVLVFIPINFKNVLLSSSRFVYYLIVLKFFLSIIAPFRQNKIEKSKDKF